jgi:antirestriction protein ArdC
MTQISITQDVTKKILELIKWVNTGEIEYWFPLPGLAYNPVSKHTYSSVNQLLLSFSLYQRDYNHNHWLTFKQISESGGLVCKGEKATPVTFTEAFYFKNKEKIPAKQAQELLRDTRQKVREATYQTIGINIKRFFKYYWVFNVAQTLNLSEDLLYSNQILYSSIELHEEVELLVLEVGARIVHVSANSAHYDWWNDKIQMPFPQQFSSKENYYATLFHELIHWSGHPMRMNRPMGRKESEEYAFEELVAELGSALLCAHFLIPAPLTSTAAYVKAWLQALENDQMYILKAIKEAEKAVLFFTTKSTISV